MSIKQVYSELGFTDLYQVGQPNDKIDVGEFAAFGVDKIYFSGDFPAIFFKEVKAFDEATLKEIAKIQHLVWNYRKVLFLFVTSKTEVRIYNCSETPFNYELPGINLHSKLKAYEIISEEISALDQIREIFSRVAVDSGTLWHTENKLRDKINIENRIDRFLVKSLLSAAKQLKAGKLSDEIIHSLLMRSIFIMYLEDKGAARDTTLYSKIKKDAKGYFEILDDVGATYQLFEKLERHFNGNVFPIIPGEEKKVKLSTLKTIRKCLYDGDLSDNPKLFEWRLFKFDIIQIELLSEIYEHFLEEFKSTTKEEAGQYYTPPTLVEMILNDKLKTNAYETNWQVKILDPACGSGIFLVESYKRLIKRWKNANPNRTIEFNDLKEILTKNIYGIEYDRLAIRVATFSLYLTLVEQLNPSTLWIDNSRKFPYLINDASDTTLSRQGSNLFRADTVSEISTDSFTKVDLVIGNPPFGSKTSKHKPTYNFCKSLGYGQDLVIPFLHKSISFAPNGSVALIFNTKILTNTEGPFKNFRSWLFSETYVEKIYNLSIFRKALKKFGGQLFSSAVGPVSILFYQKRAPEKSSTTIEYWAPKTYVKNSLIEGVVIDSSDIKFLPRDECQDPSTKIWKVAMWGGLEDYALINRLNRDFTPLRAILKEHKIEDGVGFQLLTSTSDEPRIDNQMADLGYLDADCITPYYTSKNSLQPINTTIKTKKAIKFYLDYYKKRSLIDLPKINAFRRLGDKDAYVKPHMLIKKGLYQGLTCASYVDYNCSFRDGVYGFYGESGSEKILKVIAAFLNSTLCNYYLFLSSSSYGIERDQIMKGEYLDTPFINLNDGQVDSIVKIIDDYIRRTKKNFMHVENLREILDEHFYQMFSITKYEKYLIEDLLNLSVDLFTNGHKSNALKPTNAKERDNYASTLSNHLRSFIGTKQTVNVFGYDINRHQPLNLIKIKFGGTESPNIKYEASEFEERLKAIDKYLLKSDGLNIYIKKTIKYYDNDTIYIVKPNQKRFWSRATGMNDAHDIINDILNMR